MKGMMLLGLLAVAGVANADTAAKPACETNYKQEGSFFGGRRFSTFDVLLADLVMPQEDGIALIRKVRASSAPNVASIPAAAVSGRTRQEERREALAAGFHVHVSKPVDAAQLADTVARLVRGNATVH